MMPFPTWPSVGLNVICALAFVAFLPDLTLALQCYRCDALNQPVSDCPGWIRRPVDSLRDLNDRGGLYTHCVDIRLANGTVLYQDLHPERPTCMGNFLSIWRDKLVKDFKQDVSVICCEWNRCNGPNAMASKPESHFFMHFALAVILLIKNMLPTS